MRTHTRAVILIIACLMQVPAHADTTLVLFRHAEKPQLGLGQLSCQGLNRALALPDVLLKKFGKADALFAPNPSVKTNDHGQAYSYVRPLATLEPTAILLGLPVNVDWGYKDIGALEHALLSPEYAGQTLYVTWEHKQLVRLARSIMKQAGADSASVPDWAADDFDSLYTIRLDKNGRADFSIAHQDLNGQSANCP